MRDASGTKAAADAGRARYETAAAALRQRYAAIPPGVPVRLAKTTSNLFRPRRRRRATVRLDARPFTTVLHVDPVARTADVGGMTTYEDLVAATLPHGLMPSVVPQLKTITVGGAIAGLGIESRSWRAGLAHEGVRELEVLTGDGRLLTVTADNDHAGLFAGFPNSYGTLGYALRVRIDLVPTSPVVALRHLRFDSARDCSTALAALCGSGEHEGTRVEFVDGTWFSPQELYLTLGRFVPSAPATSDYTGQRIYYRSVRQRRTDHLSVADYLWRWDTDWFWCSAALGVQHPVLRRLWPRPWRRSDVYHRIVRLEQRYGVARRIDRLRGLPAREPVIQDVQVPVDALPEFLDVLHAETGIAPVWLCPVRPGPDRVWPLYPLRPGQLYINVGFWSSVPRQPGQPDGAVNRRLEDAVDRLGGHKSLYSTSFYTPEQFWRHYDGAAFRRLKAAYDGSGRLADPYEKCVLRA